jgi:phospholipase/carboxylesterase
MWILADPLPPNYYVLAPRAPIQLGENQFSWHKITPQWPDLDHYGQLVENLLQKVRLWEEENELHFDQYNLMGFSQGAVMAYALAWLFPEKIGKVAALAGFIPTSWKTNAHKPKLGNKKFFVAHGNKDEIVPIENARQTVSWLEKHGADVQFCEAEIGHKISANCFSGLGEFFS